MKEELSDTQRRVREILVPDGKPLGEQGRSRKGTIRSMPGGLSAAQTLLERFKPLGNIVELESYRGSFISLEPWKLGMKPVGIGLREQARSGEPTLDVRIEYVPEITKIKFIPEESDSDSQSEDL